MGQPAAKAAESGAPQVRIGSEIAVSQNRFTHAINTRCAFASSATQIKGVETPVAIRKILKCSNHGLVHACLRETIATDKSIDSSAVAGHVASGRGWILQQPNARTF
jgi:hypothetical protein